jgi:hypothetical protein
MCDSSRARLMFFFVAVCFCIKICTLQSQWGSVSFDCFYILVLVWIWVWICFYNSVSICVWICFYISVSVSISICVWIWNWNCFYVSLSICVWFCFYISIMYLCRCRCTSAFVRFYDCLDLSLLSWHCPILDPFLIQSQNYYCLSLHLHQRFSFNVSTFQFKLNCVGLMPNLLLQICSQKTPYQCQSHSVLLRTQDLGLILCSICNLVSCFSSQSQSSLCFLWAFGLPES